jgi:hypothetical protein
MLAAYVTALLTISGVGPSVTTAQGQQVIVGIVVDGTERVNFVPRLEPYTQGGPSVGVPVREGEAKTKEGLAVRGFEFIGWREGDGYRVFAFVIVPAKAGTDSSGDRRLNFGSMHVRPGEAVVFEKMRDVGLTPWTIKVRPRV